MTCYDLRFPELARALVTAGAELLVVPAAWVAGPGKADHWTTLARARAIENTVYVAAAGQPGPRYTGHSMVVAPRGEVLTAAGEEEAPGHRGGGRRRAGGRARGEPVAAQPAPLTWVRPRWYPRGVRWGLTPSSSS